MRQDAKKRNDNKYRKTTTRTAIKNLLEITDKSKAEDFLPQVISKIDKLVKKNIWHKNKAAHKKSKLMKHVNSL